MFNSDERTIMWHNSYLKPRIFGLDGRVFVIVLVTALHVRLWTLELTGLTAFTFAVVELWRGITIEDALRGIRSYIAGPNRPGRNDIAGRRSVDFGYAEWFLYREEIGLPNFSMNLSSPDNSASVNSKKKK